MRLLFISLGLLSLVGCKESEKPVTPSAPTEVKSAEKSVNSITLDSRFSDWASGAVKVKAVVFDCSEGKGEKLLGFSSDRSLVEEGVEHPYIVHAASRYLTTSETVELANLVTGEHLPPAGAGCYVPHHGFIFYDVDDSVVAYIEVCLMCEKARPKPYEGLAEVWDYDGLSRFISKIGLPVFDNLDAFTSYFKTKQQQADQGAGDNGGQAR